MEVIKGVFSGSLGANEQAQRAKLTGACWCQMKVFLNFSEGKYFLNSLEVSLGPIQVFLLVPAFKFLSSGGFQSFVWD